MTVLLCPLCSQPRFNNLESLRVSLINAATQNISCPICNEVLMGLDKLTIHLFGHTINQADVQCLELKISKPEDATVNNVAEKLAEPDPLKDIVGYELLQEDDKLKSSTVNMEDLSFLTSWENPFKTEDSKDSETKTPSPKETPEEDVKDDSTGLSEYMSDLLNKKLPILNFAFTMETPEKEEKPEEEFKCPTCEFSFQNSIFLSMHQELAHKVKLETLSESPNPDGQVLNEFVLPRYDCHLCPKSFKMKGSLLVHYRVAHVGADREQGNQNGSEEKNFLCSICSKSFKKEQHLTQHIKTHEGKQWRCETCNKHFTTKYFLKKHQRLHTGEMPYSCQTCKKTFTFQQSYHKHLLYHSDEKPHRCTQCGRSFKELSTLHNHQRIHSGEKPFACETCGKCFRQRVSYIVHQRIHTGVLPYQCTACKKKFRYKVSQRSHKCTATPPGIVVRQPGDLIQRILEQRNDVSPTLTPSV